MVRSLVALAVLVAMVISVPALLARSRRRRRLRVERVGGAAVLRMPRGHWALLSTVAAIPFAAITLPAALGAWSGGAGAGRWGPSAWLGAAGLLYAAYLMALEVRSSVRVDEAGLVKAGALGRRALAWDEVSRVTVDRAGRWFLLSGPGGRSVYVGAGLDGLATFADLALRRLPPRVLEASPPAEAALQALARR